MIEIRGWSRNAKDYSGRTLKEVVHVTINGQEKALGFSDLKRTIRLNLQEREEATPLLDAIENGRR